MTKPPAPLHLRGLVRRGPVRISQHDRRLILAMIDAGLQDQKIHAFFSQPGRDFNHNQISALRNGDRRYLPAPASRAGSEVVRTVKAINGNGTCAYGR